MHERKELRRDLPNGSRIVAELEIRTGKDAAHRGGFSLCGSLYEKHGTWNGAARERNGRDPDACGQIIDELFLRAFPNLKPFARMHLSSEDGVPMHPGNALYFFREGVRGKEMSEDYARCAACWILRVDSLPPDWDTLSDEKKSESKPSDLTIAFNRFVEEQKPRWKKEAEDARALFASLTSDTIAQISKHDNVRILRGLWRNRIGLVTATSTISVQISVNGVTKWFGRNEIERA